MLAVIVLSALTLISGAVIVASTLVLLHRSRQRRREFHDRILCLKGEATTEEAWALLLPWLQDKLAEEQQPLSYIIGAAPTFIIGVTGLMITALA